MWAWPARGSMTLRSNAGSRTRTYTSAARQRNQPAPSDRSSPEPYTFHLAFLRKPGFNARVSGGPAETHTSRSPGSLGTPFMTRPRLMALCVSATLLLPGTSYAATLYQYNFDNGTSGTWTPSGANWTICRTVTTGTPE